ncbi:unnamed protein product [Rotaria sp. Silwood1]|nr:unnamed protein product [Rotaria sp. Silwood1]
MPGIRLFGRRFNFASDDLTISSLIDIALRLPLLVAFIVFRIKDESPDSTCPTSFYNGYFYPLLSVYSAITITASFMFFISLRGTPVKNTRPRRHMPLLIYIRLFLVLIDIGINIMGLIIAIRVFHMCAIILRATILTTIVLSWTVAIALFIVLAFFIDLTGVVTAEKKWEMRIKLIFCCGGGYGGQSSDIKNIVKTLQYLFDDERVDLVPSDVAAGLVLLQQEDTLEERSMNITQNVPIELLKEGLYYNSYAQSAFGCLDWMSHDGAESVIYIGDQRIQQRSVDIKDLDDDLAQQQQQKQKQQQQQTNNNRSKILQKGLHHSYQEASTNLIPPNSSNSNMMQQRSLSTNIPLVQNLKPNRINLLVLPNTDQANSINNNKIVSSESFIRTASKRRREFGKDKRNVSSNVIPSHMISDEQQTKVYQINETNTKPPSSSLQVRHPDLRRTKSDDARNLIAENQDDSSTNEIALNSHETKSDTHISSTTTNGILVPTSSSNTTQQHLSPNMINTVNSRHILQRSPSSTTSSARSNSPAEVFRSQRGSISFDIQTPLINPSTLPTTNKTKILTTYSILPTCITKPRLKFSMVRDTAMASFSHNAPVYSMPIARDYSIDEKTNRIVNEFLMHDPSLDKKKNTNDDISYRGTPKRHHHRTRQKTLEETVSINNIQRQSPQQQQSRSPVNKQRHHSSLQTSMRKHTHNQYPSVHLPDNMEQEEDSSDPALPSLKINQQSTVTVRRDNNLTVESPSIIITGDDSGSQ